MDSSFGRHIGEAMVAAVVFIAVASCLAGVALSFVVPFIFHHVSVAFH